MQELNVTRKLQVISNEDKPDINQYDLIGIGTPVYIFRPPFIVIDYLKTLPLLNSKPFFVFLLYGTLPGTAGNILRKTLAQKGGKEIGYAKFKGADYFIGYIKRGFLYSPDNPKTKELDQAVQFGSEIIDHISSKTYDQPGTDPLPTAIHTFERMVTAKVFARYMLSYFFKADPNKCSSCKLCEKICPKHNISFDGNGMPKWGHDCILCFYCELKCPEDAVSTPADWIIFAPLIQFNIYHHNVKESCEYVRVKHHKGKTQRI
ncbi:MAG: EFR1 family ferrodoxin [Desulfobacterales bacterium]|nr:EFR1 family ferrodoxin [Desulfobacterales bacterium]